MPRRRYPPGHPCYSCLDGQVLGPNGVCVDADEAGGGPLPGDCGLDEDCPPGQLCQNGRCTPGEGEFLDFLDDPASGGGMEATSRGDSALPYPVPQFEEVSAHALTRDKIVVNKGLSTYFWDFDLTSEFDPFKKLIKQEQFQELLNGLGEEFDGGALPAPFEGLDNTQLQTRRYYDFPYLCDSYNLYSRASEDAQDPVVSEIVRPSIMDPLRWAAGKVWGYTPHINPTKLPSMGAYSDSLISWNGVPGEFPFNYRTREIGAKSKEWSFIYDLKNNVFDYNNFISISFSKAIKSGSVKGEKKVVFVQKDVSPADLDRLGLEEGDLGNTFLEEEFWINLDGSYWSAQDPTPGLEFLKAYLSGYGDKNDPDRYKAIMSKLVGEKGKGILSSENQKLDYYDYSHRIKMPIFEREDKQISFSSKLAASVSLHSNFLESRITPSRDRDPLKDPKVDIENFKEFEGPEVSMSNVYRYFKEFVKKDTDSECKTGLYNDEILKFTSKNISDHFSEIYSKYKKSFPMVAEVSFDTVQNNSIADLFQSHGMDKYFLDTYEKYESQEDMGDGSHYPQTYTQEGESFDLASMTKLTNLDMFGKASITNGDVFFTEFLEQAADLDPLSTSPIDLNYATYNRNLNGLISNEKILFRTPRINTNLGSFLLALDTRTIERFDEAMFPLGAHLPEHFSTALASLNREMFSAKLQGLAWENYNNRPDDYVDTDQRDTRDYSTIAGRFRTFEDVIAGKFAYTEVVGYVVRKYDITSGVQTARLVQKFYFMDSSEVQKIQFLDSQIKYNKKYRYYISAITAVIGSKYTYAIAGDSGGEDIRANLLNLYLEGDIDVVSMDLLRDWYETDVAKGEAQIKCIVRSAPSFLFVEVPYFRKTIVTVDRPPLPPQVEIIPYKSEPTSIDGYLLDNPRKVLMSLTPSSGISVATPESMGLATDGQQIASMIEAQDSRASLENETVDSNLTNKIEYSGDSLPSSYQVFVLQNPESAPVSYSSFKDPSKVRVYSYGTTIVAGEQTGSLYVDFDLIPNTEYYMCFRAVDQVAGFSNPSDVYYVQLVQYADGIYLIMEEYQFPQDASVSSRTFQRALRVTPTRRQLQELSTGVFSEDSIWNKKYRMRLKSKKTGKTVDVDFDFKVTDSVTEYDPPPCPEGFVRLSSRGECVRVNDPILCGKTDEIGFIPDEDVPNVPTQPIVSLCPQDSNVRIYTCDMAGETGDPTAASAARDDANIGDALMRTNFPPRWIEEECSAINGGKNLKEYDEISNEVIGAEALAAANIIGSHTLETVEGICPANEEAYWLPAEFGEPGKYYIGCRCATKGEVRCADCETGDCMSDECPVDEFWDSEDCMCKARCNSPLVYDLVLGACKCPPGFVEAPGVGPLSTRGCVPLPIIDSCPGQYNPCDRESPNIRIPDDMMDHPEDDPYVQEFQDRCTLRCPVPNLTRIGLDQEGRGGPMLGPDGRPINSTQDLINRTAGSVDDEPAGFVTETCCENEIPYDTTAGRQVCCYLGETNTGTVPNLSNTGNAIEDFRDQVFGGGPLSPASGCRAGCRDACGSAVWGKPTSYFTGDGQTTRASGPYPPKPGMVVASWIECALPCDEDEELELRRQGCRCLCTGVEPSGPFNALDTRVLDTTATDEIILYGDGFYGAYPEQDDDRPPGLEYECLWDNDCPAYTYCSLPMRGSQVTIYRTEEPTEFGRRLAESQADLAPISRDGRWTRNRDEAKRPIRAYTPGFCDRGSRAQYEGLRGTET